MACCGIVPPHILEGIANSTENSEDVRAQARAAREHQRNRMAERAERSAHSHHHGAGGSHRPTGIIPRDLLQRIADSESNDEATRARAKRDLEEMDKSASSKQEILSEARDGRAPYRSVYHCHHTLKTPGELVRAEGDLAVEDLEGDAINEAYDNAGKVLKFYKDIFGWNSIDGKGLDIAQNVHYGVKYENAGWDDDNLEMVYGDGDTFIYNFTGCLDVVAHEMTHGVTTFTRDLHYQDQSGALNEHVSDVFGIMCKQYFENASAEADDWLIGEGMLMPGIKGVALRSMKEPGTAYNNRGIGGKDPQVGHMKDFVHTTADNGGVHLNSGIPNKAFFLVAQAFGGFSYQTAGQIWWKARNSSQVGYDCTFQQFADVTVECAKEYGRDAAKAVRQAWRDVGVERDI